MCRKTQNRNYCTTFSVVLFFYKNREELCIYFKRICIVQRISASRENKTNIETIRAVDISMYVEKTFLLPVQMNYAFLQSTEMNDR